ncbi:MAG: AhpC/TSA family protein [Gammaproteobacteria bacterium]|nr:AhpC/TSA family protein [Gammaproteobacteria bacterium]
MIIDAKYKSWFIFPAVGILILMLLGSLVMAAITRETTAWLGAAIATLGLPIILTQLTLRPSPRTSENLPLLLFITAVGVLIAGWEQFIVESSEWMPTAVALAAGLIFLMYVFWYSRFGRFDSSSLMVGSKLPEFSLKDLEGNQFDSSSLAGSPAVIVFYRGNWCPLCMAQIREIADRYREMTAMGIKVLLISPQSDEHSRELAARFDAPMTFLVDERNQVAEQLGIAIRNGVPLGIPGGYEPDSVMPTVVVTSANGTILFSDQTDNYRVRPEPDIFLAILRRSGVTAK